MNISESIDAILASDEVIGEQFYRVFLELYPEVQEHFHGVNMMRQAALLTTALIIVESFASSPHRATEEYLKYLGSKHERLHIPKEHYALWMDAMLRSLSTFHGDDWNDDLAAEWRQAFESTIACMFEGYGQHIQV